MLENVRSIDQFFEENNLGTPSSWQRTAIQHKQMKLEDFLPFPDNFFSLERKLSLNLSRKFNKVLGYLQLGLPSEYEPALKCIIANIIAHDLPVHDSFIVESMYKDELDLVMKREFQNILNIKEGTELKGLIK